MNNLLIIKLRYIGDVLLATPVLRALRERFPDARLTMLVNRGTEEILKSILISTTSWCLNGAALPGSFVCFMT